MGQDKDFEYLGKIQDYFAEHKTLPTFSHVAQLLGFKSKNAVSSFVARLKLQGFLDYAPDKRLKPGRRFFERILAESTVQAGFATPAYGDSLDTIGIDDYLIEKPSQTILITVRGDSMKDAGIFNGDVVIVEKRAFANVGDIVVAILNKEFTLKTLGKEDGQFILIPANKDFPVIRPTEDFEIFGVVVGQFRKYV